MYQFCSNWKVSYSTTILFICLIDFGSFSPEDTISPTFLRSLIALRGYATEAYLGMDEMVMTTNDND